MRIIRRYYLHHVLFWLLLLVGWHYFRFQDYPPKNALWISLLKVADLAMLVYSTNYLLIPYFLYKKKYWLFGMFFLIMIVTSSVFKLYLLSHLLNNPGVFSIAGGLKARVYDNVLPHILLVSTGAAFKLLLDQERSQQMMAELVREKANAELDFLKSQINPHFVFNSLNAVYFLITKENTEARKTLLEFSDLLRYQLYDCNAPAIEIEKEINFLKNYIRLQELRKDESYKVSFLIGEDVKGFAIAPLLLVPFVENAFKHISHHTDKSNFVDVAINYSAGKMIFSVRNARDLNQRVTEPIGGIGLQNVKRRLQLLYNKKYDLLIKETDSVFAIELTLEV